MAWPVLHLSAMTRALLAIAAVASAWSQSLPSALLTHSTFAGRPSKAAFDVGSPRDVSIAVDPAGIRYVAYAKADRAYISRHDGLGATVWETEFADARIEALAVGTDGALLAVGTRTVKDAPGFVSKLGPDGRVLWATDVEGQPAAIRTDKEGNVYIAGQAGPRFQPTPGALKTVRDEPLCSYDRHGVQRYVCDDGFVAKLAPDGRRTIWATLLGGPAEDVIEGMDLGPDGSVYVVGRTGGAVVGPSATPIDMAAGRGFVHRIEPGGSRLLFGADSVPPRTYRLSSLAVDASGGVYVGGTAVPRVEGRHWDDAVIARLNATGQTLASATFEESADAVNDLSLAPDGRLFASVYRTRVVELDPASLAVVRSVVPRIPGHWAIRAASAGRVHLAVHSLWYPVSPFVVSPDAQTSGAAWVAEYDFNRDSQPAVISLVNGASFREKGSIAPAELITFFGEKLGSTSTVHLDGRSLSILYSSSSQINALVPEDQPIGVASLRVETGGSTIGTWNVQVARSSMGLFTRIEQSYIRVAAALNQNGEVNSSGTPADAGSVVALFGTGFGRAGDQQLRPMEGAQIVYAGAAPGLPGVQQINLRLSPVAPPVGHVVLKITTAGGEDLIEETVYLWVK